MTALSSPRLAALAVFIMLGVSGLEVARAADPVIEVRAPVFPSVQIYLRAVDDAWPDATAEVAFARAADHPAAAAVDALADAHRADPSATDLPPLVALPPAAVTARVVPFDAQTAPSEGMLLVLLVDDSASMPGRPIERVEASVEALVAALRPHDRVAVVAFSTDTRVITPPTADRTAATAAVRDLPLDGKRTHIYSAVNQAISVDIPAMQRDLGDAFPSLPGRRALVVFSDGLDEDSPVPVADVIDKLGKLESRGLGLTLLTVGVGAKAAHHRDLQRLADVATFGPHKAQRYFDRPEPAELVTAWRALLGHLTEQLRVDFEVPVDDWLDGPTRVELRLSTPAGAVSAIPLTLAPSTLTIGQRTQARSHRSARDAAVNWYRARGERDAHLRLAAIGGVSLVLVIVVGLLVRRSLSRRDADRRDAIAGVRAGLDQKLRDVEQQIAGSEQAIGDRLAQYTQQLGDEHRRALATLVAVAGPLRGRRYGVIRTPCVAGRQDTCDIVFPPDTDAAISRQHAEFSYDSGRWRVRCLAAGGLDVNGEAVRKGDVYTLEVGDRLGLGKSTFLFGGPA